MKDTYIRVRVSEIEKETIIKNASSHENVSDFVRERCLPANAPVKGTIVDENTKQKVSLALGIIAGTIDSDNILSSSVELMGISPEAQLKNSFDDVLKQKAIDILSQAFV